MWSFVIFIIIIRLIFAGLKILYCLAKEREDEKITQEFINKWYSKGKIESRITKIEKENRKNA